MINETIGASAQPGSHKITLLENRTRALSAADFGFYNTTSISMVGVLITSLPANGSLVRYLAGGDPVTVDAGEWISQADLEAGNLVFRPDATLAAGNSTSLEFRLEDMNGMPPETDTSIDTLTITVLQVGQIATTPVQLNGTSQFTLAADRILSVADTAIKWSGNSTNAVLDNAGLIESTAGGGRAFNASGIATGPRTLTFINRDGAVVQSQNDAIRINVDAPDLRIKVVNAGLIESIVDGQAIDFDAVKSTSQAGQIEIVNEATGVIRAKGADGIRPGELAIIRNAGLIHAAGVVGDKNDGVDWQGRHGVVDNMTGGVISGQRHGITSDVHVDVVNATGAQIIGRNGSGVGSDGTGAVVNYGLIVGAYDGSGTGDGDGIDIDGYATIENYGTIAGLGAGGVDKNGDTNLGEGIAVTGGGTIINYASGVIEGEYRGVFAYGGVTITNAGTIVGGTIGATLWGPIAGSLINSGTISSDGNAVVAQSAPGTKVVNDGQGRIHGGASEGVGVYGVDAEIVNHGTIDGRLGVQFSGTLHNEAGGVISGDIGAYAFGQGTSLYNVGTIIGNRGVYAAGAAHVTNAGAILSDFTAIELSAYDDILTIQKGSHITGYVFGGDGADTLILQNGATFDVGFGFETLVVAGEVMILGANNFAAVRMEAEATLFLGNGASLGDATIDFSDGPAALSVGEGAVFSNGLTSFGTDDAIYLLDLEGVSATVTRVNSEYHVTDRLGRSVEFTASLEVNLRLIAGEDSNGHAVVTAAPHAHLNDFNADGYGDFVWQNTRTGKVTTWSVTGNDAGEVEFRQNTTKDAPGVDRQVIGSLDWNGDGAFDLLVRDKDGAFGIWTARPGESFARDTYLNNSVSPDWKVAGVGDFNGDGRGDIAWRNSLTGNFTTWSSTGTGFVANDYTDSSVSKDWKLAGTLDWNGDGRDDILWRQDGGKFTIWTGSEDGFSKNSYKDASVSNDWRLEAIGDMSGDGRSDLIWRHVQTGELTTWIADDGGFKKNVYEDRTISPEWRVAQVVDMNSDGRADLVFRNEQTSEVTIWHSSGDSFNPNVASIKSVSDDWALIGHGGMIIGG